MNSNKILILFTFILLFLTSAIATAQNDHEKLFEKAKYTMETKGDLKGAVILFEEIIKNYPNKNAIGAKSQYYIGLCYQKLGLDKAKIEFEKVINNYPRQFEIVSLAKDRLTAIKSTEQNSLTTNKDFQLQQVWAKPFDTMGAPSPDGRYISYVNWNKPCLSIYEFSKEKSKDVEGTEGTWGGNYQYAESSIWSPDGNKLAYVWYDKDGVSIRTIGLDSSEPVEVFRDKKLQYCHPCTWSADGKYILTILCHKNHEHEIVLVAIKDKSVQTIKRLEAGYHPWITLSPDGNYVAYSFTPDMNSPETDIYIYDIINKSEERIINHPSTDFNPLWMPDGNNLIFFSDRTGTMGVWSQEISNGKKQGEEKLVKNLNRLEPKSITSDGELYMFFNEGGCDIYNAFIEKQKGKLVSEPKRFVQTNVGWNSGGCFSPDGKKLAYVSKRGVLSTDVSWGQQHLIIRDLESGKEKEIIPRMRQILRGRSPLKWSPNSDEILCVGRGENGSAGAFILNINDSSIKPVPRENDYVFHEMIWGNNSDKFYYYYFGDAESNGIYSVDRANKKETMLINEQNIKGLALQPKGNKLAVVSGNVIKILNLESNQFERDFALESDVKHTCITWSPDGVWLYFIKCRSHQTVELWRVKSDLTEPQLVDDSLPHILHLAFHPDGEKITMTVGGRSNSSLWVMKNFIPE